MQEYGTIGPKLVAWEKRPCLIVGGGPTLIPYQNKLWDLHQRGNCVAVNDSYKRMNSPDLIVSIDHAWIKNQLELDKVRFMPCPVIVAVDVSNPRTPSSNLTYIKRLHRNGISDHARLSDDPTQAVNGMQSAHFALQVAYLKGAKTIFLLGMDFKEIGDRAHFHDGYKYFKDGEGNSRRNSNRLYPTWAKAMADTVPQLKAAGVEVFNCSPDSLMTCFPHKPYSEVL